MTFAKWTYRIAGIYGILLISAMALMDLDRFGREFPPALTHVEFYYGFLAVTFAWQVAFLVIGQDPARYRPFMLVTLLEKFPYAVIVSVLVAQGQTSPTFLGAAVLDSILGVLFLASYVRTRPKAAEVTPIRSLATAAA